MSHSIPTKPEEKLLCTFCLAPLFDKKDSHSVPRVNCRNYACPYYKIAISRKIIESIEWIRQRAREKPPKDVQDD